MFLVITDWRIQKPNVPLIWQNFEKVMLLVETKTEHVQLIHQNIDWKGDWKAIMWLQFQTEEKEENK